MFGEKFSGNVKISDMENFHTFTRKDSSKFP